MQKTTVCLIFLSLLLSNIYAQDSTKSKVQAVLPMLRVNYAYQIPGGDLQKRFGDNSNIGVAFSLLTKNDFQFGVQGEAIFDGSVHEPGLLGEIFNVSGKLTNLDGQQTIVNMEERGFAVFLTAAKLFPLSSSNKTGSGFLVELGAGYLQHKIKIDYRDGKLYQLTDELLKGYDRLSGGLAFRQSVGYQFLSKRNLVNFYLGLEITEAFTKSIRGYNYDTMEHDNKSRFDMYTGIRAGWIIPFRKRRSEVYYYY